MSDVRSTGPTEVNRPVDLPKVTALPRLTAIAGPSTGRSLVLAQALATVGRHPSNDLVITDARVSGVQLELRRVNDRVHVRDAGSTNGTWLGRHRITEIELAQGGEVSIGDTILRLDLDDGAVPVSTSTNENFGDLVGISPPMRELFATLERVTPKNLSVLIQGETGTGKEEVARAIHGQSARKAAPFIVIDPTSLPEALAESLLFGHEKGAFPGADEARPGLFEAAKGGTIFLDEVGEMPEKLQSKFLRVLERQEITRVGAHEPLKIDVRIVAATHRDLRHEIEAGRFREDLYFRLAQIRLMLPPLRDRQEDVPVLCKKLLETIAPGRGLTIEAEAVTHLGSQPWPGNVRELRNVLSRAIALATETVIRQRDVVGEGFGFRGTREEREALDLSGTFVTAKERAVERFESAYLTALMRKCAGNLSAASRQADIARHHLRDILKKRGLYGVSWNEGDEK